MINFEIKTFINLNLFEAKLLSLANSRNQFIPHTESINSENILPFFLLLFIHFLLNVGSDSFLSLLTFFFGRLLFFNDCVLGVSLALSFHSPPFSIDVEHCLPICSEKDDSVQSCYKGLTYREPGPEARDSNLELDGQEVGHG